MSDKTKELVEKIHQFLSLQVETNNELSDAAKESLTVASECIEQAYKIQRKPASNELLDIYQRGVSPSSTTNLPGGGDSATPNPAQFNPQNFIQNLASSILSSASASVSASSQGGQTATQTTSSTTQATPQPSAPSAEPSAPPASKSRKRATDAERLAAESFKNQGNDLMKQDKYKEAYDCYTQAIEIDSNNAIYYSNRAAASSKLGDHQGALRDCQEAVEIDANYSKAYGRMGLAYASLEDHQKAKEAYVKAVELDPHNESYRNNLKIAEEKLNEAQNSGATGGAQNVMVNMLRSMMGQPEVMQMAMRSLQDPRMMQNLFSGLTGQAATGDQATGQQQQQSAPTTGANTTPNNQQNSAPASETQSQSSTATNTESGTTNSATNNPPGGINPSDLFGNLNNSANLLGVGQQLLSSLAQNNPDLIGDMRRVVNQFMPPANNNNQQNDSDRNPPPGYS